MILELLIAILLLALFLHVCGLVYSDMKSDIAEHKRVKMAKDKGACANCMFWNTSGERLADVHSRLFGRRCNIPHAIRVYGERKCTTITTEADYSCKFFREADYSRSAKQFGHAKIYPYHMGLGPDNTEDDPPEGWGAAIHKEVKTDGE